MNSNMKKTIMTAVVLTALAAFFVPGPAMARMGGMGSMGGFGGGYTGNGAGGHGMGLYGIWQNTRLAEELKLSPEQLTALKEKYFETREKHIQIRSRLATLKLDMDKTLATEPVDDNHVLEIARQIASVQGEFSLIGVENRLAMKKLLTNEQLDKLEGMGFGMHMGFMDGGMGYGRNMGRGRMMMGRGKMMMSGNNWTPPCLADTADNQITQPEIQEEKTK